MRREKGVEIEKIQSEHQIGFSCPFQMLRSPPGLLSLPLLAVLRFPAHLAAA